MTRRGRRCEIERIYSGTSQERVQRVMPQAVTGCTQALRVPLIQEELRRGNRQATKVVIGNIQAALESVSYKVLWQDASGSEVWWVHAGGSWNPVVEVIYGCLTACGWSSRGQIRQKGLQWCDQEFHSVIQCLLP